VTLNSSLNIATLGNYKLAQTIAVWLLLGCLISAAAWLPLHFSAQLGVLWFLVLAWLLAPRRSAAFALMFAYYVVIGRDVPTAIQRFTDIALPLAWAITVLYSVAVAALWAFAWQRQPSRRILGLLAILWITTVPPLGGFVTGSPLLTAGWAYPSMGLTGVVLLVMSWVSIYLHFSKPSMKTASATVFVVLMLGSAYSNLNLKTTEASHVYPIHTKLPVFPVQLAAQYERQLELTQSALDALKQPQAIVVMPEEIAGTWQPRYAWLWEEVNKAYLSEAKTLIVGFDTQPDQYANTAKIFGKKPSAQPDIYARVPAPVGGWKPWSEVHAPARWTNTATVELQNHRLALFFCWEELVPWPWMATALATAGQPTEAVIMVNHWFAKDLDIGDSQARSSEAWARLLGWSYTRVINVF
jgi:apolipoprotein N-acyltransferase